MANAATLTVFFNEDNAKITLRNNESEASTKLARTAKKHECELLGHEIAIKAGKNGPQAIVNGETFALFEGKGGSWYCYLESSKPVNPKDWFKS